MHMTTHVRRRAILAALAAATTRADGIGQASGVKHGKEEADDSDGCDAGLAASVKTTGKKLSGVLVSVLLCWRNCELKFQLKQTF